MNARVLMLLILALLPHAPAVQAQAPAKVARIGYLTPTPNAERLASFREGMAARGYTEGKNLVLEVRDAQGRFERLPALAQELVRLDVDVIVASLTQASLAAKGATTTIPIVMAAVGDPVGAGIVRSLAKPGANITGNSLATIDVLGKLFELLRELRPSLFRMDASDSDAFSTLVLHLSPTRVRSGALERPRIIAHGMEHDAARRCSRGDGPRRRSCLFLRR